MPKSGSAILLDDTGALLQLPHDLVLPFARVVARNKITHLKRFNFSRTYRKHIVGAKPREFYEGAFDIVTPRVSSGLAAMVADAEVVKFLAEVLEQFPTELSPHFLRVGIEQNLFKYIR